MNTPYIEVGLVAHILMPDNTERTHAFTLKVPAEDYKLCLSRAKDAYWRHAVRVGGAQSVWLRETGYPVSLEKDIQALKALSQPPSSRRHA